MSSILTVTQLNTYLSLKLKNDPKLRGIALKGEISDFHINQRSGHAYFTLCDQGSVIKAVMFRSQAEKLRFMPFDGMSVIAYGNVDIYIQDGVYEINVSQLLPDGEGSAYLALQKLKEKLDAMGVFSAPKRPIPRYPQKIAVVTSATGAAIEDVRNVISRRYPPAVIELFPTAVQGADAPQSIVSALMKADSSGADTIILTRGGGSSDDLSAFNTEAVALAVFNCTTPLISAVGHEINWFLCDLAADLRAPTPSGAAELATPDIREMLASLISLQSMLNRCAESKLRHFGDSLRRYEYALSAFSVKGKISARSAEIKLLTATIDRQARHKLAVSRLSLDGLSRTLRSLDPKNVLSRGYAFIYKGSEIVSDAEKLAEGDNIKVIMRGGSADATVNKVNFGDNSEI